MNPQKQTSIKDQLGTSQIAEASITTSGTCGIKGSKKYSRGIFGCNGSTLSFMDTFTSSSIFKADLKEIAKIVKLNNGTGFCIGFNDGTEYIVVLIPSTKQLVSKLVKLSMLLCSLVLIVRAGLIYVQADDGMLRVTQWAVLRPVFAVAAMVYVLAIFGLNKYMKAGSTRDNITAWLVYFDRMKVSVFNS